MNAQSLQTAREPDVRHRTFMRWLVVGCQAASILLTWSLWQVRTTGEAPPNLPAFDLALLDRLQVPCGELLLLTLAATLVWPRVGAIAHAAVLAASIVLDQMRIQPEFISLAILLLGTLASPGLLLAARGHLVSLWFWAGLHKLASPEYIHVTGPDLVLGLFPAASPRTAMLLGITVAVAELALGLAAMFPVARRGVAEAAAALHGMVLLLLVARGWNTAVWPWNLALAAAGFGFFAGWQGSLWPTCCTNAPASPPPDAAIQPSRTWLARVLLTAWMLYPALFYLNACDGYLAWCVYASNVPDAVVYDADAPDGERLFDRAYESLNVPFSPAVRIYEQHFRCRGQIDDRMEIDDPRPLSRWRGRGKRVWILTGDGPAEIHR